MNVQQIMEDAMLKQHAQILQEILLVLAKLDTLEMVSVAKVKKNFGQENIYLFIAFRSINKLIKLIDTDECLTNNGGCHAQATCTNTPGSFSCACKLGYSGNGFDCTGIFYFIFFFFPFPLFGFVLKFLILIYFQQLNVHQYQLEMQIIQPQLQEIQH